MSNLHKLFNELRKLSENERGLLQELLRESNTVEIQCKNLGVEYTDAMLINWLNNTAHYRVSSLSINSPPTINTLNNTPDPTAECMKKIITGDNLDIIEEAAEKKGLI